MTEIKDYIDNFLARSARLFYRNSIKTLIVMILLTSVFGANLLQLTINTATEGYLDKNHPELVNFREFIDQFGRGTQDVCIAVKAPDIFNLQFLSKLKSLHDEIEKSVPQLVNILSLINARNIRTESENLIVEELFETWPQAEEELIQLKKRAINNPLYINTLFSEDMTHATILIETKGFKESGGRKQADVFDGFESNMNSNPGKKEKPLEKEFTTSSDSCKIITSVYKIIKKYDAPGFEIYLSGSRAVNHYVSTALMNDMNLFFGLSIFLVIIILSIMFKRATGVVFPLLVASLSLLSTFGLMVFCKEPLTLPSQILPAFLIAVGVGYVIHILSIFFRNYDEQGDKEKAIAFAFRHSGLAIVLTGVTTSAGLLSFISAELAPVKGFGIFAASGVLFALIYTMILIPSLIALIPIKQKQSSGGINKNQPINRLLSTIADFTIHHPYLILCFSALVILFSVAGILNIRLGHDIIRWMPEDSVLRRGTEKIDQALHGSNILHVVLDFKQKDSLMEPALLNKLDESKDILEKLTVGPVYVGKAWSIASIVKEINQALHDGQEAYYTIPQDKNLIAQEFLLFENSGSDDLADYTDKQFKKAHFFLKLPYLDAVYYGKFFEKVRQHFENMFPDTKIVLTGIFKIYIQTFASTLISMTRSYLFSMISISILMLLFLGMRYGLLSLIPNLFPIIFSLGLMGWLNLPMNFSTMMMACIAIGLAVDDTIHFMNTFRKYYEKIGDVERAIHMTFQTTGRAVLMTSIVLTLGFMVFMMATLSNFFDFGLLTAVAIFMALLSDFFITPSILLIWKKQKKLLPQKYQWAKN